MAKGTVHAAPHARAAAVAPPTPRYLAVMAKIRVKHHGAKAKAKDSKEKAVSSTSSKAASSSSTGITKKKHSLAKREHALLPQLAAGAPEPKKAESAKAKMRRKRSAKSAILGAVDGMRSTLDELFEENERRHREQPADDGGALTTKKRQKLVAEEAAHMEQVIQHPAFVADPFAALQEHLKNVLDGAASGKRRNQRDV